MGSNPIKRIDPDGKEPTDFTVLVAEEGAGGYGHMAAVIQDGQGQYYYVTMGATEDGSLSKMASDGVEGGMSVQLLEGAKTMEEAINVAKQDQNNSPYTDHVTFDTSSKTDEKIFGEVTKLAEQINSGEVKYNVLNMNCIDAIERPIENATGVEFPDGMKPNQNFQELKDEQKNIQTKIDIKTGDYKVIYIPSGLDNFPAQPIIIPPDDPYTDF